MNPSNFEKFPVAAYSEERAYRGWKEIAASIGTAVSRLDAAKRIIVIECYHGADVSLLVKELMSAKPGALFINAADMLLPQDKIDPMIFPFVTNDPVFGYITSLELNDFFNQIKIAEIRNKLAAALQDEVYIFGAGASLISATPDLLVYADMPRWEIQLRFRRNELSNFGASNADAEFAYQYKRAFFVDWRVMDELKKRLIHKWDFLLDTTQPADPKMVSGAALRDALSEVVKKPFRVVPFFDPGPWGGQWLKEVCDLDRSEKNFAWGFDCVPEENSLMIGFGDTVIEIPSIDLVFFQPEKLLGKPVYESFGAEFPIRFDFLDTMEGGNLSLQVHPLKPYIREHFGMGYTQDESYYFIDAQEDAFVYLGLKDNIVPDKMIGALQDAQEAGGFFEADDFVEKWPVKKHDHVLIPAGTVHCSGANSMVLEISATPYIFTFKLWDWGRMGLDGKPRPISLEHGARSIQWDRTPAWTAKNIMNHFEKIGEGDGWMEERTGLYKDSFIETRRHSFTGKVTHHTGGVVNVINLVEGNEVVVESPTGAFEPYIIHYVETFIVPAEVGAFTITPHGASAGKLCMTLKAYVRKENLFNNRIN